MPTPAINTDFMTVDRWSGKIAVATRRGQVSVIDPETGDTDALPVLEPIVNIGFGREGELLALTGADGTVRLWDVERSTSAGVVWSGTGAVAGSPSWYDPVTDSMWVASSGRLLSIPLEPAGWIERACEIAGRGFTQEEWDRYVPRGGAVQSACGGDR